MKHRKLYSVISVFILLAAFLSGCGDSKDINDQLIATTIIFDYKDGEIWYYLEIANIETGNNKESGTSANKYIVRKGNGKTLTEVRDDLDAHLDKPLYLSGIRTLIFTESFARKHLVEYLYRYRADEGYRKKGLTVITKEDPEELYKSAHEQNTSTGLLAEGIVKTLDESGKSFLRTTIRLIENLSAEYTGILIPCIGFHDKELAVIGYSVISGSDVVGLLPAPESRGTMFLKADKAKFYYSVPYNEVNYAIEVRVKKKRIKPTYEEGKINFSIKMDCSAELGYGDKKTPYNLNKAALDEISETLAATLEQEISDAVKRAQTEFACDYLQFDDIFRVKFPVEFERMDWGKEFPQVGASVDVKVKLSTKWGMDYSAGEAK